MIANKRSNVLLGVKIGPADVVHHHGDVQVLERRDELREVVAALRRVGDEVSDLRHVRLALPSHGRTQLFHDSLHLRLVPPVQDHVESARQKFRRCRLAYPVGGSSHDGIRSSAVEVMLDRAGAEEVEPEEVEDAVDVGDCEDDTE